MIILCTL